MVSCTYLTKYFYILHDLISVLQCLLFPQLFIDLEESIFDLKTYFDFKGRFPYLRFSSQSKYLYRKKWFSSTKIKLQILSNKNKNFSNTGRQFFSRPTLYVSQSAYLPFDHSVTLLLCHSVTLSFFHFATVSLCYSVTPSLRHSVTLTLWHSVTLSHYHSVTLSFCHSVTLSLCHDVWLPRSLTLSLSLSSPTPLSLSPHSLTRSLSNWAILPICKVIGPSVWSISQSSILSLPQSLNLPCLSLSLSFRQSASLFNILLVSPPFSKFDCLSIYLCISHLFVFVFRSSSCQTSCACSRARPPSD